MADDLHKKFHHLLEGFTDGVLVTQGGDGPMIGRPMQVCQIDDDCDLWFVTGSESAKVDDVKEDSRVLVVFQDSGRYLTVNGAASLVRDRSKVQELWNESWRVWFPNGPDDPTLVLLRVKATDGQFWDQGGFRGLTYAIEAGRAYWKGETPELPEDMHAKVNLD
ncbi:Pyridoxamine 5'-phosphate oxidase [Pseudobythopirellula maris]|uniref:Pyridoxamine 5'-phosphate oxidase n=1 Tax=Pseudobythopirellula maris TaxID=2527991 RepID=A0A5C5ZSU0_9BACT|nr:pyridoxamine 5'-phosphate oxidase family protein [Pseudobythopirellula maris]TWT90135.1 Pyridoxamine 5'-phosphate oxidase [Pseudobythopirellula maris]